MIFHGGEKSGVKVKITGGLLVLKQPSALYDGLGSWRRITSCASTKVIVDGSFYAETEAFHALVFSANCFTNK